MKIKILFATAIVGWSSTQSQFSAAQLPIKGLEKAAEIFAPEIIQALVVSTAVQTAGNFSPIIDSSVVKAIRENHKQFVAEYPVYVEYLRDTYALPESFQLSKDFNNALKNFFEDPACIVAKSGSEILALDSYKQVKEAAAKSSEFSKTFMQAYEARMPLLCTLTGVYVEWTKAMYNRLEKAVACITLDKSLYELFAEKGLSLTKIDLKEIAEEKNILESYSQILHFAVKMEKYLHRTSSVLEDEGLWQFLRALRIEKDTIILPNEQRVTLEELQKIAVTEVQNIIAQEQELVNQKISARA